MFKMVMVLSVIGITMGFTLSFMEMVTKKPIEYSRLRYVKGPAVLSVFSGYENDPIMDYKKDQELAGNVIKSLFPAKKDGKYFAVAFEVAGKGYHGEMGIMMGIDIRSGHLTGVRVMTHTETPGLGAKVTEPAFYGQFSGLGIKDLALSGKGGKINGISGATKSSQGVAEAVKKGLELFENNRDRILRFLGQE
jgi:electron transport complex protein RnfG